MSSGGMAAVRRLLSGTARQASLPSSIHRGGATRMNGLSYSRFMYGLKLAEVTVNRKMLAELAVNDPAGFTALAEIAKAKLA